MSDDDVLRCTLCEQPITITEYEGHWNMDREIKDGVAFRDDPTMIAHRRCLRENGMPHMEREYV